MRIEIGKYAGFCRGVKHAVDTVFQVARSTDNVLTDGELIHNPQTLSQLTEHGVRELSGSDDLSGNTVIVRAHGITPERMHELKSRAKHVVNLTCRDVAKVQGIIKKHDASGGAVVIFGKADHPEVIGLRGFARTSYVVQNEADVASLPVLTKPLFVSQTTMEMAAFAALAERMAARFPGIVIINTICNATELRQREVAEMAARNDCIIVVGGAASSNTKRLVEIAARTVTTFAVESAEAIHTLDLRKKGYRRIGITAGASTPDWLIEEVASAVRENASHPLFRIAEDILRFIIYTNLFPAAGVLLIPFAVADITGRRYPINIALIAALYYFAMSVFNNYTNRAGLRASDRIRYDFVYRFRIVFLVAFLASGGAVVAASYLYGLNIFMLTAFAVVLGLGYNASYLPMPGGERRLLFFRLKNVPAFKSLVISTALTVLVNGLIIVDDRSVLIDHHFAFLFSGALVFCVMFTRQTLLELKTAQSDRIAGVTGLLSLVRPRHLMISLIVLQACMLAAMTAGIIAGLYPLQKIVYFIPVLFNGVLILFARNRTILRSKYAYEFLIDSNLWITGVIGIL
ncbi:MAG: 4-hydroxy-3-methylbut-2-enyl diphosphate reductase [Spirochaetota bacterium]